MGRIFRRDGDVPKRSLWQRIKDIALADVGVVVRGGPDQGSLERLEEVLLDADFGAATLQRVSFSGCTLTRADFTKVTCTDVDLRHARLGAGGAGDAGIRAGFDALRGARIDNLQLVTLAPLLAQHLGITVADDA